MIQALIGITLALLMVVGLIAAFFSEKCKSLAGSIEELKTENEELKAVTQERMQKLVDEKNLLIDQVKRYLSPLYPQFDGSDELYMSLLKDLIDKRDALDRINIGEARAYARDICDSFLGEMEDVVSQVESIRKKCE
jgi:hypothetical protein